MLDLENNGSSTIDARSGLSLLVYACLTPSLIISSNDISASHSTSIPTSTNTLTMPVSWHIGRLPKADNFELIKICAIAFFAESLVSFS